MRRRRWGRNAGATARRARRIFGAPKFWQWIVSRGLKIQPVREKNVCGEWITPEFADSPDKIIFYLHGGGYVSCSPKTHRPITASLARQTKFKIFALDYRLAPEYLFPAALEDAVAAYQSLLENGFDSKKIAVAGESAGGGLIVSLILRLREMNVSPPACAVCFSPWTDMTASGESSVSNAERDALFYPENIAEFAAACLGAKTSPFNKYASPALADDNVFQNFPPALFQVGADEILLDDSRRVYEKIKAADDDGGKSELEIYKDVFHGWQMLSWLTPESVRSLENAAAFIKRHI